MYVCMSALVAMTCIFFFFHIFGSKKGVGLVVCLIFSRTYTTTIGQIDLIYPICHTGTVNTCRACTHSTRVHDHVRLHCHCNTTYSSRWQVYSCLDECTYTRVLPAYRYCTRVSVRLECIDIVGHCRMHRQKVAHVATSPYMHCIPVPVPGTGRMLWPY